MSFQSPASPGDTTATPKLSLWETVTGLFKSAPAPRAAEPVAPPSMPVPPPPRVAPAPQVLHLAKGQGTLLRRALKPGADATASEPTGAAEMPRPTSVLPEIVLVPAVKFLQASRTVLSAWRKAPPTREVAPAADAAEKAAPSRRLAPETRFKDGDYPIV